MQKVIQGNGQTVLNVCGCGRLHFTYGPMTLHFEREEFMRFAGEVGRLAAHLQHVIAGRESILAQGQNDMVCH
ncbi:MAG: hypothetical protein AB1411_03205 [Nitrospirota bacterium]